MKKYLQPVEYAKTKSKKSLRISTSTGMGLEREGSKLGSISGFRGDPEVNSSAATDRRQDQTRLNDPEIAAAFAVVKRNSAGAEDELRNAEGGGLSISEFAEMLGSLSEEQVKALLASNDFFAWKHAGEIKLPSWQIHNGAPLPKLRVVLAIISAKEPHPLAIISFFIGKSGDLKGRSPLDLLRKNRTKEVVDYARRYGGIGC